VYTTLLMEYNAHGIVEVCQLQTEIRYVEFLHLCMDNSKII
jgi:hypothetical protein